MPRLLCKVRTNDFHLSIGHEVGRAGARALDPA